MDIGIIGTGAIGLSFARHVARAGLSLLIANSRGPETLVDTAALLGPSVSAAHVRDAAAADIVMIAVPWARLATAVEELPPWAGRVVIDPMNPLGPPDFRVADLGGRLSTEHVEDAVPGARVVKAFNTLAPPVLSRDPNECGGRRVIFYSGNDGEARATVGSLIKRLGFAGIDLGTLARGGALQSFPGGPLPTLNLFQLP